MLEHDTATGGGGTVSQMWGQSDGWRAWSFANPSRHVGAGDNARTAWKETSMDGEQNGAQAQQDAQQETQQATGATGAGKPAGGTTSRLTLRPFIV